MIDEDKLLAEWEIDAKLDKSDLTTETLRIASLHPKYLRLLMEAKRAKDRSEQIFNKTKHLMIQYYQGVMTKAEMDKYKLKYDPYKGASKPLKTNMWPWIDNDARVVKAAGDLNKHKDMVSAIEEIINTIRWRHNAVKNINDIKKFDAGY